MIKLGDTYLWENLGFKAGWLITSFIMTKAEVEKRREKVCDILNKFCDVEVIVTEEWVWMDFKSFLSDSKRDRIFALMEENSILIDALQYLSTSTTRNWTSIGDIRKTVVALHFRKNEANMDSIYDFIDKSISKIASDLVEAIKNWYIIPSDLQLIQLWELIDEKNKFLNPWINYEEIPEV